MPALNFKKQFAEAVENGTKRQTIRATRVHPIKPGDRLYLYTGMRTSACRKLGEACCLETKKICISEKSISFFFVESQTHDAPARWVTVELSSDSLDRIARADGFESIDAFIDFFKKEHGLPFYGQLITW